MAGRYQFSPGRMFETLRSILWGRSHAKVVCECRNCGTVVDADERCPSCDSEEIARFEIE